MTFAAASHFAETWGLAFAVILFLAAVIYALWPSNRKTFDKASRAPLTKDEDDDQA
ncbi:MAG: cbb3-type cytochrome c oxidase subunit 3 [Alphaproteobacteria bacterium]|nr:cbb3-type cytochrome c oxidase subunit 3 [Alphaproteobacteria bacterium]